MTRAELQEIMNYSRDCVRQWPSGKRSPAAREALLVLDEIERDGAMTADELRALIERHEQEVPEGIPHARMAWHPRHAQAHEDRGALLALARRPEAALREMEPGKCPLCGDPECPAPVLEVLHDHG